MGIINKNKKRNIALIIVFVLIVWGRQDGWISLESAHRFNLLISGSELAVIDNAGHVSMEEQPQTVNKRILEFLDKFKT